MNTLNTNSFKISPCSESDNVTLDATRTTTETIRQNRQLKTNQHSYMYIFTLIIFVFPVSPSRVEESMKFVQVVTFSHFGGIRIIIDDSAY